MESSMEVMVQSKCHPVGLAQSYALFIPKLFRIPMTTTVWMYGCGSTSILISYSNIVRALGECQLGLGQLTLNGWGSYASKSVQYYTVRNLFESRYIISLELKYLNDLIVSISYFLLVSGIPVLRPKKKRTGWGDAAEKIRKREMIIEGMIQVCI